MTTHIDCLAVEQRVNHLVELLARAIRVETAVYRQTRDDEAAQSEAGSVVSECVDALLAVPAADLATLDANGYGYNYRLGLALATRRDLIMEGDYSAANRDARLACRLVDTLLAGTPYDAVPMLWHINGEPFEQRPDAAMLAAAESASVSH